MEVCRDTKYGFGVGEEVGRFVLTGGSVGLAMGQLVAAVAIVEFGSSTSDTSTADELVLVAPKSVGAISVSFAVHPVNMKHE